MNINGAGNKSLSETAARNGRILVVDPDDAVVDTLRAHFARNGFVVDSCASGDELYNTELDQYRLMIIDLEVDDDRSLGVIAQIKQSEATCNIPVIACSTRMSPTTIISALNNGADDYIIKPFPINELMARANALLRRL